MNKLICTYVFLPLFITSKEPGDCALTAHPSMYMHPQAPPRTLPWALQGCRLPSSLWWALLGDNCSYLGVFCEENTCLLQKRRDDVFILYFLHQVKQDTRHFSGSSSSLLLIQALAQGSPCAGRQRWAGTCRDTVCVPQPHPSIFIG